MARLGAVPDPAMEVEEREATASARPSSQVRGRRGIVLGSSAVQTLSVLAAAVDSAAEVVVGMAVDGRVPLMPWRESAEARRHSAWMASLAAAAAVQEAHWLAADRTSC